MCDCMNANISFHRIAHSRLHRIAQSYEFRLNWKKRIRWW